jgi:amphi-Trp domain-containing protein
MADNKEDFEFSAYADSETVASYLESLATQIRKGNAQLSAGSGTINLHFGSPIKLDIEAEMDSEKGKGSIELELSWQLAASPSDERIVIEDACEAHEETEQAEEPAAALTVAEES